jgi:hypothetical protein
VAPDVAIEAPGDAIEAPGDDADKGDDPLAADSDAAAFIDDGGVTVTGVEETDGVVTGGTATASAADGTVGWVSPVGLV